MDCVVLSFEMPFYNNHTYSYRHQSPPPSPLLAPVPFSGPRPYTTSSFKNIREPLGPSEEFVKQYESCPAAAKACCHFVESGSRRVDTHELKLYRRQVPGSDGKGLVIGVALQSASGELQPLIIIENDMSNTTSKGIYFTGTLVNDQSQSFVACLSKSAELHPVYRLMIYLDYVNMLQNRSASFIWDWWKSGLDMDGAGSDLDRKIRDGQ